ADSLGMLLRLMGHEAEVAYDGRAALEAALASAPEVVLLDIGMPGMNGYEVARRLRERADFAGVLVAVTGWAPEGDVRKAREAGFDHHLTKPVDTRVLLGLLAEVPARRPARAGAS